MPAVNPELQKAVLSIYVEEDEDAGILTDEQGWLSVWDEEQLFCENVRVLLLKINYNAVVD